MKLDEIELGQLVYYWEEKDDLERYSGWAALQPDLLINYPEIIAAWNQYKISRRMLSAVLRGTVIKRP